MSDRLLDTINAITAASLQISKGLADSIFESSPFLEALRQAEKYYYKRPKWETTARRRMFAAGVQHERITEVLKEMYKARGEIFEEYATDGGINGLTEDVNDGANSSWNGNTYASYGSITRSK